MMHRHSACHVKDTAKMAQAVEARRQPYMDKVPDLRQKFLDKHYSSEKNVYDSRDISRVKSDDLFVVQFLNAKEGNVDKAHKIMVEALKWRNSFGINDLTEKDIPDEVWRSHVAYSYGRDKKGAYVGYAMLNRYTFKGNKELCLGYQKMTAFNFERFQRAHPGCKMTFVSSAEGAALTQVDMDSNKFGAKLLLTCYPDILENSYILHYTKIFEAIWKVTKALLGPLSKKYVFTTSEELTQYIDKDQLPLEFGGPSFVYKYSPEEKTDANSNDPTSTVSQ